MPLSFEIERRFLQGAVAVGVLVPLSAGLAGAAIGPAIIDNPAVFSAALESHFSYLSGLLFAIGLCFASCIPKVEQKTDRVRILTFLVLVGGICRLYALYRTGHPDKFMIGALVMELCVTPFLAGWQTRLANRARERSVLSPRLS